ncbi:hypothetical protein HY416_00700 [Candidatus Kaiserbacteria bacterium]|nr:hypothetical protein [Candidatus Kaiserbacteria bacterium]
MDKFFLKKIRVFKENLFLSNPVTEDQKNSKTDRPSIPRNSLRTLFLQAGRALVDGIGTFLASDQ